MTWVTWGLVAMVAILCWPLPKNWKTRMSERPKGFNEVDAELGRPIRDANARYDALTPAPSRAPGPAQEG